MLKVYARYQGKHLDLGYQKGKRYHLNLVINADNKVEISPEGNNPESKEQVCIYSTLKTFTDNWKILG